jgi:RNA polymerase subunit RPABC4/transcription elongation factor Spt4
MWLCRKCEEEQEERYDYCPSCESGDDEKEGEE